MLLADIGNSFAHLYSNGKIENLDINSLIKKYKDKKLYYINVNPRYKELLATQKNWINLEEYVSLENSYPEMGIDRKVLLLSRGDGIYVDAGSAITIDKKENNRFIGGTIIPGIKALKEAYSLISPKLKIEKLDRVNLNKLPNSSTKESISYGIIAPIVALIKTINSSNLPIYCCGGDGELILEYLDNATYNRALIFEGMKKVIKENLC